MAHRYIGEAFVNVDYHARSGEYRGYVRVGKSIWHFDDTYLDKVRAGASPESPSSYDEIAKGAVSFGSYFTSLHKGKRPKWAPPTPVADDIYQAIYGAIDARGRFAVRRTKDGAPRWK